MANLVSFGAFELDLRARELRKHELKIRLPEQSIQILAMLLERPGQVVLREEIQKKLWPNDTIVEFDHSINAAVKRLRRALGDEAETPRYVETLPRRGYRFIYPLDAVGPDPVPSQPAQPGAPTQGAPQAPAIVLIAPPSEEAGSAVVTAAAAGPADLIGRTVSRYRVLARIGSGAMGVIYKAEDTRLGRTVALKFLPAELAQDRQALARFQREARAASALNHPNICTVYDIDEHAGQPFIAMELLEGETLKDRLTVGAGLVRGRGAPLQIDTLLDLAIQIAAGLEAAHGKGIIHRDIKPANIFLTTHGQAKILDFGVAKLTRRGGHLARRGMAGATGPALQETATLSIDLEHLTSPGSPIGTAAYMSPEQVRGEALDTRTDIFSFGAVLYEMATGRQAFPGETSSEVQQAILTQQPVSPKSLYPDLPPKLEEIINKALEKDRELRYQHASEMRAELQRLKRDTDSSRAVTAVPQRNRQRKLVLSALAAVLILAAGFGYHYYVRGPLHKPALTEKDTVLVADFTNRTGNPVWDGTLEQALAVALHQSPFLSVLSDHRVAATLQLMQRPTGTTVTGEVAREVCQRAGSRAYIAGSIAALGSQYVLGLKAVGCAGGETLAEEQATASGKENVVNALGQEAAKLRRRAGRIAGLGAEIRYSSRTSHHPFARGSESLQHGGEGPKRARLGGGAALL